MSDWISVTERLPEPGVPVLATFRAYARNEVIRAEYSDGKSLEVDPEHEMDDAIYDEENDRYLCPVGWFERNYYEDVHWNVYGPVTHWMPLPEGPKL